MRLIRLFLLMLGIASWGAGCAENSVVLTRESRSASQMSQQVCRVAGRLMPAEGVSATEFEAVVKEFLSAEIDPSWFGEIGAEVSSPTGVFFDLQLKSDSARLVLRVRDSLVGQIGSNGAPIGEYVLNFVQPSTWAFERTNGVVNSAWQDDYGRVVLNGIWKNSQFEGEISFVNSTHFSGGQPASGVLGSISLHSCQ
ncbi:MAG: hypothetical protein N2578_05410 [Bdellovibrionaceae bacterium]|nr:hypothetical protein [Pseudobdellovibrionaceae bacterium]